jgi:hypothetical protein
MAMRALRFGWVLALFATAALGAYAAYPGNDRLALALAALTREPDRQLDFTLTQLIASAEIGPEGEVFLNAALGDRRFLEPNSGRYWQISGGGYEDFRSRSLWDRTLAVGARTAWAEPRYYDSDQFPDEPLRVLERTVRLPGSDVAWRFVVARSRDERE